MSKFIEVTDVYMDNEKRVLNTECIAEVRALKRGHHPAKSWVHFNKEEIYCQEPFEDIKAMLMYDPAVADIVIGGNHD